MKLMPVVLGIGFITISLATCTTKQGEMPIPAKNTAEAFPIPYIVRGEPPLMDARPGVASVFRDKRCPAEEMVYVEGEYCPSVVEQCEHWLDDDHRRCAKFSSPTICNSEHTEHKAFCIDRF